jgi:hypothetical protein
MSGVNNTINCPNCRTPHTLRGKALTRAMACTKCRIYFRTGSWNPDRTTFNKVVEPALPIGSKGEIDGYVYEVMGFVVKQERKYKYSWREYLIFNRHQGYAFLSEYDGHWNMVWPVEDDPRDSKSATEQSFFQGSEQYRLYQKYHADVTYARGEFFFDVVAMTRDTRNAEYICPPYLYALETSDDSLLWCKGEYMERRKIASIFSVPLSKLPGKSGMGYTQPSPSPFSKSALLISLIVFILAALAIQTLQSSYAAEENIFQSTFFLAALKDQKFAATKSFDLKGGPQSIQINIFVPVDNDWFISEFALVNETTGDEYNFTKEIEFYRGYEEGYAWSEGGTTAEAFISSLPDGRYHVNMYPDFGATVTRCDMIIWRDVPNRGNLLWTVLGLAIFPTVYLLWTHAREKRRWADSDYSPYD